MENYSTTPVMLHLSLDASSIMQSLLQRELILINFLPPKRLFLEQHIYQRIINHWLKLAPKLGFSLFIKFIVKYLCPLCRQKPESKICKIREGNLTLTTLSLIFGYIHLFLKNDFRIGKVLEKSVKTAKKA